MPCGMHDCFQARVYVLSAITLIATLALMLCHLYVIDSISLSFNPTYRIERCLLFRASVASSRKCRDRLGTREEIPCQTPRIPTVAVGSVRYAKHIIQYCRDVMDQEITKLLIFNIAVPDVCRVTVTRSRWSHWELPGGISMFVLIF